MSTDEINLTFAEKQLLKYGWKKGMGLGKNKNGIMEPIKLKSNKEKLGFGADVNAPYQHWWDTAYNNAVKSIDVSRKEDGTIHITKKKRKTEISCKPNLINFNRTLEHFKQAGTLRDGTLISNEAATDSEDDSNSTCTKGVLLDLTDQQLLKLCNGATAHKGARHGIRMGGKMKRLQEMEALEAGNRAKTKANNVSSTKSLKPSFTYSSDKLDILLEDCNPFLKFDECTKIPRGEVESFRPKNKCEIIGEESTLNVSKRSKKRSKCCLADVEETVNECTDNVVGFGKEKRSDAYSSSVFDEWRNNGAETRETCNVQSESVGLKSECKVKKKRRKNNEGDSQASKRVCKLKTIRPTHATLCNDE